MVHKISLSVFFVLSALLAACAPRGNQPAPSEPQSLEATSMPENVPPTEVVPATEAPSVSTLWVGYRDPRYGIGLAFPCWWAFTPMSTEGIGGSMYLRSVDEDYVRAHSVKGYWQDGIVPEGVFALDIGVFEGLDPTLSTVDAWASLNDPTMSEIASAEEQMIGQNQATVVQMRNVDNGSGTISTLYLFRLSPDKILMFNPHYQDRLDASDIQGILTSLSLSPDVPIQVPTVAPHEPLIPAACAEN